MANEIYDNGTVDNSAGTEMPDGILKPMRPIVGNGKTTAVKQSDNSGPPSLTRDLNKDAAPAPITPLLSDALRGHGPGVRRRVLNVVKKKG